MSDLSVSDHDTPVWSSGKVASIMQRLGIDDGPHDAQSLFESVLAELHGLLRDHKSDDLEQFETHLAISLVVRANTFWSATEAVDETLGHLRSAYNLAAQDDFDHPLEGTDALVAAMLGAELALHASNSNFDETVSLIDEAEQCLRWAIARTPDSHSADLIKRKANLAIHLTANSRGETAYQKTQEAEALLEQTIQLVGGSDPEVLAKLLCAKGHAQEKLARYEGLSDLERISLLDKAEASYIQATKVADGAKIEPPATGNARLLLAMSRFACTGDESQLDVAVRVGTEGLHLLKVDEPHYFEALMNLAEAYHERYMSSREESDLRNAVELSQQSVGSWHLNRNGTKLNELRHRRIVLLATAASAPGDWGPERSELPALLGQVFDVEGLHEIPAEVEFLWLEERLRRERLDVSGRNPTRATSLLDSLLKTALAGEFKRGQFGFIVRYAAAELDLYKSLGYHNPDLIDPARLLAAANLLRLRLLEQVGLSPSDRHYALYLVASLTTAFALQTRSEAHYRQAFDTLEVARSLTVEVDSAPLGNLCEAEVAWFESGFYLGKQTDLVRLTDLANRLPLAKHPSQLAEAGPRLRRSYAGLIGTAPDPLDAIWAQYATANGHDATDDALKRVWLDDILEASGKAAKIFLAMTQTHAVAHVVSSGEVRRIDLPDLAAQKLGPLVSNAHRAHHRAGLPGATVSAKNEWRQARQVLFAAALSALLPIQNTIRESTEVDCSLSGYAHLLPVVPVLADLSGYSVPIASTCLLYTSPSPRDATLSRMPSSA